MKTVKGNKPKKEWHASSSKIGMGDFYGSGIKQKIGTMKRDYLNGPMVSKKIKTPPKTLA